MSNNLAYVYKWIHAPTKKWYVGSRTAKNANPFDGYVCSSRVVKALVLENKPDWDSMSATRKGVLKSDEHKNNISLAKVGKPAWPKGKKRSQQTDEHKARAKAGRKLATEKRKLAKLQDSTKLLHLSNNTVDVVHPIKELKK